MNERMNEKSRTDHREASRVRLHPAIHAAARPSSQRPPTSRRGSPIRPGLGDSLEWVVIDEARRQVRRRQPRRLTVDRHDL